MSKTGFCVERAFQSRSSVGSRRRAFNHSATEGNHSAAKRQNMSMVHFDQCIHSLSEYFERGGGQMQIIYKINDLMYVHPEKFTIPPKCRTRIKIVQSPNLSHWPSVCTNHTASKWKKSLQSCNRRDQASFINFKWSSQRILHFDSTSIIYSPLHCGKI